MSLSLLEKLILAELYSTILNHLEFGDWTALQCTSWTIRHNTRPIGEQIINADKLSFLYSHEGLRLLAAVAGNVDLVHKPRKILIHITNCPVFDLRGMECDRRVEMKNYYNKCRETWFEELEEQGMLPPVLNQSLGAAENATDTAWKLYERFSGEQEALIAARKDIQLLSRAFGRFAEAGVEMSFHINDSEPSVLNHHDYRSRVFGYTWPFILHAPSFTAHFAGDETRVITSEHVIQTGLRAATSNRVDIRSITIDPVLWDNFDLCILSQQQEVSLMRVEEFAIRTSNCNYHTDHGWEFGLPIVMGRFVSFLAGHSLRRMSLGCNFYDTNVRALPKWSWVPDTILSIDYPHLESFRLHDAKAKAVKVYDFLARHPGLKRLEFESVALSGGLWSRAFGLVTDVSRLEKFVVGSLSDFEEQNGEEVCFRYFFLDALHGMTEESTNRFETDEPSRMRDSLVYVRDLQMS